MGGMRDTCKALEKHRYWNDFEPTSHKFFKTLVRDFRTQLRIPRKFMRNFKEELPKTVCLRGPSDLIWRISLRRTDEDVILGKGWDEFAKDHHLEETDFIVFQYAGNSTFRVVIFDASGCEREGSYFVKKHTMACSHGICSLHTEVREEAEKIIDLTKIDGKDVLHNNLQQRGKRKRIAQPVASSGRRKAAEKDAQGPVSKDLDSTRRRRKKEKNMGKRSASEVKREAPSVAPRIAEEEEEDDSKDLVGGCWPYKKYVLSNRRPVTEEEKIKTKRLAVNYKNPRPNSFYLVMKATYVTECFVLNIPKDWASQHIPEELQYFELRVPPNMKRWLVKVTRNRHRCAMSVGWCRFVLENNLEQDDACVFEPCESSPWDQNKRRLRLDIVIYRIVDEIVPLTRILRRDHKKT